MFTYFFTPPTPQNRNNRKKKKNVGILLLVPTSQGLRITHHCKIEQREAHAVLLLMHIPIYTNADIHRCFFFDNGYQKLRSFEMSKENVSKRLSICLSCTLSHTNGIECSTLQK